MPDSKAILTEEFTSFDDGIILGWTYTVTALPGECTAPPGGYIEVSSSSSMSSSGPLETKTFMHEKVFKIRKRIIVDMGGQQGAYAGIQARLPDHLSPQILGIKDASDKIMSNISDPVALVSSLGVEVGNELSDAFLCVNGLKEVAVVSQSVYQQLTSLEHFSIDFLLRTFYQGMGLKIVINQEGTASLKDLTAALSSKKSFDVPGEDILSYQQSLDNTQIPSSYIMSIDKHGHMTGEAAKPKDTGLMRNAMMNSPETRRDRYDHLSASVLPAKAIEFGLFKMVSVNAIGSSAITLEGDFATVKIGKCIDEKIQLHKRNNRLNDNFERTIPTEGKYDYGPANALISTTITNLFKGVTMYESMYKASQGVVTFKGTGLIDLWDIITIEPLSVEGYNVTQDEAVSFTSSKGGAYLVSSIEEIVEAGFPRTIAHFANLNL